MSPGARLQSLDVFRGLTVAGMILVNNPGSWSHVYAPLRHAEWHGWTPTDLVFPFFLFIVGVAVPFSLARYRTPGRRPTSAAYARILRRALMLFVLGIMLAGFPSFEIATLRIPGVLQRIALVYLAVALVVLHARWRLQAALAAAILIGYWAAMTWIEVPGFGAGDLSPEGNLAAFIDRAIVPGRLWRGTWDPEGLLSTVPAVATALLGALTGAFLRSGRDRRELAGWLFTAGWIGILAGVAWAPWFPINKNLWTSSYVLFTAGVALEVLGLCYWLIEVQGWRGWASPAVVFGRNAITAYVMSGLLARILLRYHVAEPGGSLSVHTWVYRELFASWAGPTAGSLAFAVTHVVVLWLLMLLMHRRGLHLKV